MTINHIYNPRVPSHIFPESERGEEMEKKKRKTYTLTRARTRTQVLKVSPQTVAERNTCECVRSSSRVWREVGRSIKVEIYKTEPGGAIHGGRNG